MLSKRIDGSSDSTTGKSRTTSQEGPLPERVPYSIQKKTILPYTEKRTCAKNMSMLKDTCMLTKRTGKSEAGFTQSTASTCRESSERAGGTQTRIDRNPEGCWPKEYTRLGCIQQESDCRRKKQKRRRFHQ